MVDRPSSTQLTRTLTKLEESVNNLKKTDQEQSEALKELRCTSSETNRNVQTIMQALMGMNGKGDTDGLLHEFRLVKKKVSYHGRVIWIIVGVSCFIGAVAKDVLVGLFSKG